MDFNLFLNMLTPIKKQGDEHIYILLQISIIDWVSVRYVDILRLVRMLIGSEITYRYALSILYGVHVKGNHADRDKVLLKKSCHVITPAVAKAPLCSGASQFAAGNTAVRPLSKRSNKASSDAGPELAGREAVRRWKARRP